eukprot:jgi/Chlat1/6654/Chrsp49S06126
MAAAAAVVDGAAAAASGGDGTDRIVKKEAVIFYCLALEPREPELTGAVDLLTHFNLRKPLEKAMKQEQPESIAEAGYFARSAGDTVIRRGQGLELRHLMEAPAPLQPPKLEPLSFDVLRAAFTLEESGPVYLPESAKGEVTFGAVPEERKHKHKHKERDKNKHKERDKNKDTGGVVANGESERKKHKKHKKRKREGDTDESDRHKRKKDKRKSLD